MYKQITTGQLSDDSDNDDEHVQVKPRRRVPMATANQDDSDLTVRGLFCNIVMQLSNLMYVTQ